VAFYLGRVEGREEHYLDGCYVYSLAYFGLGMGASDGKDART